MGCFVARILAMTVLVSDILVGLPARLLMGTVIASPTKEDVAIPINLPE